MTVERQPEPACAAGAVGPGSAGPSRPDTAATPGNPVAAATDHAAPTSADAAPAPGDAAVAPAGTVPTPAAPADTAAAEDPADPAEPAHGGHTTTVDSPAAVKDRAVALVSYLLAVRGLLEKPARTVPAVDAYWQHELPDHPSCRVGPDRPGGAWLRVGRPAPPPLPRLPAPLAPYVVWDATADTPPALVGLGDEADAAVPPAVAAEFTRWYEQEWREWAARAAAAEATRRLHDRLYDLRYRLDIEAARLELVWGHLVLDLAVDGDRIHYPLLATPVAVEYDPDTATVSVVPQGPPRLQPDALSGYDERRVTDLLELGGLAGQVAVDCWDEAQRHELAYRAMRRLGLDPVLRTTAAEDGRPYVLDTGVLFVRPRQRMVRRFLERMRERLQSADPDAVGALASVLAHEPSTLRMPGDDPEAWRRTGQRLLMPMATNEAQESIARRLAEYRSVAVQGPPGTGKTHTIRNLICHLIAHGRRVLVLAQKEDPLRVLRDGLPEQIQPLCLAVLGRSVDQLVQLQTAARELSDRAATLDADHERERVRQLTEEIARAEADLAAVQEQLRAAAERDATTYELDGVATPAAAVGGWLRRHEAADGYIPDPVAPGNPPPLTAAEFADLAELARRIPRADRVQAVRRLPQVTDLPTGDDLVARHDALRDARKVVAALRDRGIIVDAVRALGQERVEELAAELRAAASDLARREGSWTDRLGLLLRDPNWRRVWDDHVAACQRLMADLTQRTALLAGRRVEVPPAYAAQPRRLLQQLAAIRSRLAAGRRIGRLTGAELARTAAACLVDGEPIRSVEDADLVIAEVERGQLRSRLANRWAEWAQRLALPQPEGHAELWAGRLLAEAADALDWERRRWPDLYGTLSEAYPSCPRAVDARQAGELAGALEACGNVFLADRLEREQLQTAEWVHDLAADPQAAAVVRDLAAAYDRRDPQAWDAAVVEIARLWTVRDDAVRFAELRDRLAGVAPAWAATVDAADGGGVPLPASGEAALRAWRWRQAQTWFDQQIASVDTVELGRRAERCRDRIRRLTRELVVTSAWLEVSLALDDRKRAALADWTAALRKIGKGTGRSAPHWQAAAQRAMAEAVTAVPVWIMSIDRALEQFRGGEPQFDVVIVDEASQADIFALPVLSLAERAVVVGDDQQIGPQLVGAPTDRVNALIATYLSDVPSAVHFDTESSLYDHAVRRSPQRILLTEHFRCVPPIIEFSSRTYYDGRIQPLRADRPAGLGAPVNVVAVPDGVRTTLPDYGQVNVPEAEALVDRVAAIVADPAYAGKSLGVVSLLSGSGQAAYLLHRLRERIGADELERRALRVGDPYTFQGDERDVVLISMVAAAADGEVGAFTKRDFHRRVNVAASRARDQMWLFCSIGVKDLHPDDARARLLAYCLAPRPAEDDDAVAAEQRCETDMELDVLRMLSERGLRPVPQYRIGTYRIDFVLAAPDGRRLAIECDTDGYRDPAAFARDLRRQAVLERVGNCVFVRLRESIFQRDPEAAMAPVWDRARHLGILA